MPHKWRPAQASDVLCAGLLFGWLLSLPLPFGSNTAAAFPLITIGPSLICLLAAGGRLVAARSRLPIESTRPYLFLTVGSLLWLGVVLIQLIPLPGALAAIFSPTAAEIWRGGNRALAFAGIPQRDWFPLTIDIEATTREFHRSLGIFAAFQAAALLIRTHARRMTLVAVLSASALFQVGYAVNEAALGRYAIWGWKNPRNYGRATGTFVNPNHFAHYLAIVIPLLVFVLAALWRHAAPPGTPARIRFAKLVEKHLLLSGFVMLSIGASMTAILLAQSRGSLVALFGGSSIIIAIAAGRSMGSRLRGLAIAGGLAGILLIAVSLLVVFLGTERTVARFIPTAADASNLIGRTTGITAAAELWSRFTLVGSGAGTFASVVSMVQRADLAKIYQHAHNDYLEIIATTGTAGGVIALVTLLGGYLLLLRMTTGVGSSTIRWRRRAFQLAALGSLTVAMVHALFDFNFFIPANPLTLAVIVGASVAPLVHDMRTPR